MKSKIAILAISLILVATGAQAADAMPYQQKQDVVYAEVHGTGLLMDIFTPTGTANGLAVVDVVSGAWYSDRGKIRDHSMAQVYTVLCQHGYVVFAARPGSKTRYSVAEMDQHIKKAIRFVKHSSADYKIDPDRLGITGASAGGHLATLAALTPLEANPDAKPSVDRFDTNVRAVAVFFPPTDFLDWGDGRMLDSKILAPLLFVGGTDGRSEQEIKDAAMAASPFHRVQKPAAPFLLIHGDADPVVPLSHSKKLVEAITRAGGNAELMIKVGGGHPWLTIAEDVRVMADWFDKQLRAAPLAATK